jgi:TPR repeat protein
MLRKRADANDPWAMYNLGCAYFDGNIVPQDDKKAVELWMRAGELGCALAHNKVAIAYHDGCGVEVDMTQAVHHYKQAAIGGIAEARHELGCLVQKSGDKKTAVRHWLISAGDGNEFSLAMIKDCYRRGLVTKDKFERALRDNNNANDEMKSDEREAAGAIVAIRKNFLSRMTRCVPPRTPRKTLK